jgi:fido (protein-threonine AMPylation protein)
MANRERDEQETLNMAQVLGWIEHLAVHQDILIDLDLICYLNRLTLHNTDVHYWGGRVRSEVDWQRPEEWDRPRAIVSLDEPGLGVADAETGELLVTFPADREVGVMLAELIGWLHSPAAQKAHPVIRAALFHQRFTAIHPFRDGNGRTARALTALIFQRAGYPVEILRLQRVLDERREQYMTALRAADQGNVQEWVQFFAQAVRDALG